MLAWVFRTGCGGLPGLYHTDEKALSRARDAINKEIGKA